MLQKLMKLQKIAVFESQSIKYATNPDKLKENSNKIKDKIKDITKALDNLIHVSEKELDMQS